MSAADRLLKRFEANINQSLGVRDEATSVPGRVESLQMPQGPGPNDGRTRARALGYMDITRIIPDPEQPRKEFEADALRRLSRSMVKFGQLLPIRVRWDERLGKWVIISGERRYRAALAAGLTTVSCHFVDGELSPARVLEEQLVENCLREDLKPVEQARAYRALMDENAWSARRVAEELHLASSTVVKALALLKLPEEVQEQVESGVIPATTAYELAKLKGSEAKNRVADRIAREKLSRDEAMALVRETTGRSSPLLAREETAENPPTPTPGTAGQEKLALVLREARLEEDHAALEFSLSNGVKVTIATGTQATVGDIVAALSSVLEDLRTRLVQTSDPGIPWVESPAIP
jgi:ParB family chromosome partitioning protein